jgi:hypothetical protein
MNIQLEFNVMSHRECDSQKAETFDGRLRMRLIQGLINNGEGRGAHQGLFRLDGNSDSYVLG